MRNVAADKDTVSSPGLGREGLVTPGAHSGQRDRGYLQVGGGGCYCQALGTGLG